MARSCFGPVHFGCPKMTILGVSIWDPILVIFGWGLDPSRRPSGGLNCRTKGFCPPGWWPFLGPVTGFGPLLGPIWSWFGTHFGSGF